jgi:anoctamin-10
MVPVLTGTLSNIATKLTDFENYEHESSYEAAMVQKVFVFNFICSYVPLFLTAFIYVPFGHVVVPHIDVLGLMAQPEDKMGTQAVFEVNPARLRNQVIYFTVTAQAVNLAMETIVPYFKKKALKTAKEIQDKRNGKEIAYVNDSPEEHAFLDRVRSEEDRDVYDVNDDLREMCMQVRCGPSSVDRGLPRVNLSTVRIPLLVLSSLAACSRLLPRNQLDSAP